MKTLVNGEEREFAAGATLAEVLEQLGIREERGIAVAVNDAVVPRADHRRFHPRDGDAIEIIHAVGGG